MSTMLNEAQRNLAKSIALAAGFDYDSPSRNILSPDGGCWCNQQVWKLVELTLAHKKDFDKYAETTE